MKVRFALLMAGLAGVLPACSSPRHSASRSSHTTDWRLYQTGIASWYGGRWHGRPTASGERFDQNAMTAAHRRLPFQTMVRVTNLRNGHSCLVRINDRGPFVRGRVIDLSARAAREIGVHGQGLARVSIELAR